MDLEERPHNMVEVEVGGASCTVQYSTAQYSTVCVQVGGAGSPFLLRLLHLRHNTVPSDIAVSVYQVS